MEQTAALSWGRYPRVIQQVHRLNSRHDTLPVGETSLLPYGNGRSYGDSCLNPNGLLLHTRNLDRFITFDEKTGRLCCEAGILHAEILDLVVPTGWFLPVTPGTQYVTLGGAIANDAHGKNHHRAGSFGCHVLRFELLRSDGTRLQCSPNENPDWFAATIGGLGLTGLILWAELQLRLIDSVWISTESRRFTSLDEFFRLSAESDGSYEYTVAWLDCSPHAGMRERGIFSRGNHAPVSLAGGPAEPRQRRSSIPLTPPISLINPLSLRLFNTLYYHRQGADIRQDLVHYRPFLYPLDSIEHWNRLYGPNGFFQLQCVIPPENGLPAIREMIAQIVRSGAGSALAVLKVFGQRSSPGLLSFPRPGVTLAVDFPNRGPATLALLRSLDRIIDQAGGAIYPAKDARMNGEQFRRYFPRWREFGDYVDPRFSSGFWRRVTEHE